MADKGAAGHQGQGRAGGAHALEVGGILTAFVDHGVGLPKGGVEGPWRRTGGEFLVDKRHVFDGQGAGHLAGRMRPHAVGNDEQPAPASVLLDAPRGKHHLGILVTCAAPPNVGEFAAVEARA